MAISNLILTITEPTLKLDEIAIVDFESKIATENTTMIPPSKFVGMFYPLIFINLYEFTISDINTFELTLQGFLPTIRINVTDTKDIFNNRYFPLDGNVISLYIKANNEELYKAIRIDFDILNISPLQSIDNRRFIITGQMKVPGLLGEFNESYKGKSYDVLIKVANSLKLGFASNIDKSDDEMVWINPSDTRLKFIEDITSNAYVNENCFMRSYIDPFYYLTFIDVNKAFNNKDIEESEVYSKSPADLSKDIKYARVPAALTNHKDYAGNSKYISAYSMINNTGEIFLKNGYKRHVLSYDSDVNKFISEFVDPFTTDDTDSKTHLKGRLVNENSFSINSIIEGFKTLSPENIIDKHTKYKYLGKQSSYGKLNGNTHQHYIYSQVLNYQNNMEMFKMGMVIDLEIVDMSLYRFQNIPVLIYNYDPTMKATVNTNDTNMDSTVDNDKSVLNTFLSGTYLIYSILIG